MEVAEEIIGEVYNSCGDLLMYNFVKASVTKNLKHLIKSGSPTDSELTEVWELIKAEYEDLSNDSSQNYLLNLLIQIDHLDKKLIITQGLVDYLSIERSEELIEVLQNDLNFPFAYIDLDVDLKKTITKAKFDLMNLRRLEAESKEFVEDNKNEKETSELDYEEQMTILSKWQQCRYSLNDTTVTQYIALIHRFNAENKSR